MKKPIFLSLLMLFLILMVGCSNNLDGDNAKSDSNTDDFVFTAQIIKLDIGEYAVCYIVSKEDIGYGEEETLISLNLPKDQIYDKEDKKCEIEDLKEGNLLEITSDGTFLESYPLQIGTVKRVKVIKDGSPKDIEQYNDLVSQFYTE